MYCFEVLEYDTTSHTFSHLGYMDKTFCSKEEACDYYNFHCPHMNKMCKNSCYSSSFDPLNGNRAYIIREDYNMYSSIPSFEHTTLINSIFDYVPSIK